MEKYMELQLWQFACVYLLLLLVLAIMKKCDIHQSKQLIVASVKMTVQLTLAGIILTLIFENPHPAFTAAYVCVMIAFTCHRVISLNKELNRNFKIIIIASTAIGGVSVMSFFIVVVVGQSLTDPQIVIPISGMLMGNMMTGLTLAVKTFKESLYGQSVKINALQCAGARPEKILHPFVTNALETAMLPTINSMVGLGIVSLPGMMTGQILAGSMPTTAIMYQIAIMVAICAVVSITCFMTLWMGQKTLYEKNSQIILIPKHL